VARLNPAEQPEQATAVRAAVATRVAMLNKQQKLI